MTIDNFNTTVENLGSLSEAIDTASRKPISLEDKIRFQHARDDVRKAIRLLRLQTFDIEDALTPLL